MAVEFLRGVRKTVVVMDVQVFEYRKKKSLNCTLNV